MSVRQLDQRIIESVRIDRLKSISGVQVSTEMNICTYLLQKCKHVYMFQKTKIQIAWLEIKLLENVLEVEIAACSKFIFLYFLLKSFYISEKTICTACINGSYTCF